MGRYEQAFRDNIAAGFAAGDSDAARFRKPAMLLQPGTIDDTEAAALLASLLGLEPAALLLGKIGRGE